MRGILNCLDIQNGTVDQLQNISEIGEGMLLLPFSEVERSACLVKQLVALKNYIVDVGVPVLHHSVSPHVESRWIQVEFQSLGITAIVTKAILTSISLTWSSVYLLFVDIANYEEDLGSNYYNFEAMNMDVAPTSCQSCF